MSDNEKINAFIERLKRNAVQYGLKTSSYSQAKINLAEKAALNPVIVDGFLYIGDIQLEFYKITNKPIPDNFKSQIHWFELSSIELPCLSYTVK
tara:strand:+ start:91 stop:372 length:282 start_codon:yes stop_codon:yes gene_type:complete